MTMEGSFIIWSRDYLNTVTSKLSEKSNPFMFIVIRLESLNDSDESDRHIRRKYFQHIWSAKDV